MIWNSSGTLDGINDFRLGYADNQKGFVTQNNGSILVGDELKMEFGSVFTIAGGSLTANRLTIVNTNPGEDYVNFLTSGTGGTMYFRSDYVSELNTFITNGDIRIDGATANLSDFNISYDGSKTSISAVPEPSSVALLGLGGLALLMRRRK